MTKQRKLSFYLFTVLTLLWVAGSVYWYLFYIVSDPRAEKLPPVQSGAAALATAVETALPPVTIVNVEPTPSSRPDPENHPLADQEAAPVVEWFFPSGKTEPKPLTKDSNQRWQQLVERLQKQTSLHVRLEAHTDPLGGEAVNRKVASERAAAISALLQNKGIAQERIVSRIIGSAKPVTANDDPYGRMRNRRVVVQLILPETRAEMAVK